MESSVENKEMGGSSGKEFGVSGRLVEEEGCWRVMKTLFLLRKT
jgi:hypothetical protein